MLKNAFVVCGLAAALLFAGCGKDEETPDNTTTYTLTMKAAKASTGVTVYKQITYNDANGVKQTVTNQNQDFMVSFPIEPGYKISLSAVGSVSGATSVPSSLVSYRVEGPKGVICEQISSFISGAGTDYSLTASFDKTFKGDTCE